MADLQARFELELRDAIRQVTDLERRAQGPFNARVTAQVDDSGVENLRDETERGAEFPVEADTSAAENSIADLARTVSAGVAGLAVGGLFVAGFTEALSLDAASDLLASQLDLTAEQSAIAGEAAGSLYSNAYGESVEQVNEVLRGVIPVFGEITEANRAAVETSAASIIDLATITQRSTEEITRSASNLVRSGIAGSLDEALDVITVVSQRAGIAGDDLLESFEEYSSALGSAGVNAEEFGSLLIAGLEGGARNTDAIADSLREFTVLASEGGDDIADAYGRLGLSLGEVQTLINNGDTAQAFQLINQQLAGVSDETERADLAARTLGTVFSEQVGVEAVDALASAGLELENLEGAAARAGDTLNDNLATRLETLRRTVLVEVVGFIEDNVLPAVDSITPTVAEVASTVRDFLTSDDFRGFLDGLLEVGVAIADVLVPIGQDVFPVVVSGIMAVVVAGAGLVGFVQTLNEIGLLEPLLIGFATAIGVVLVPGIIAWIAQTVALTTALAAQAVALAVAYAPVTAIVVIITALVAGLIFAYQESETFRNIIDTVGAALRDGFVVALDAGRAAVDGVSAAVSAVIGFFQGFDGAAQVTGSVIGTLVDVALNPASAAIGGVSTAATFLTELLDGPVSGALGGAISIGETLAGLFFGPVTGSFQTVIDIATFLAGLYIGTVSGAFGLVIDIATFLAMLLAGQVASSFRTAQTVASALASLFTGAVAGAVRGVISVAQTLARLLSGPVNAGLGAVSAAGRVLATVIVSRVTSSLRGLQTVARAVSSFFSGVFRTGVNRAQSAFRSFQSTIDTVRRAIERVISAASRVGDAVSSGVSTARSFIPDIPFLAKGAVVDSATLAVVGEAGREVVAPVGNMSRTVDLFREAGSINGLVDELMRRGEFERIIGTEFPSAATVAPVAIPPARVALTVPPASTAPTAAAVAPVIHVHATPGMNDIEQLRQIGLQTERAVAAATTGRRGGGY